MIRGSRSPIPSRRVRPVYGYARWAHRAAWAILGLIVLASLVLAWVVMTGDVARAAELTGSQVLTVERSNAGEFYASLSIVVDLALTPQWSAVLIHDQTAQWPGGRYTEWDISAAWRPWPDWSIGLGRRWRVGQTDYRGPWVYLQVWRGM